MFRESGNFSCSFNDAAGEPSSEVVGFLGQRADLRGALRMVQSRLLRILDFDLESGIQCVIKTYINH